MKDRGIWRLAIAAALSASLAFVAAIAAFAVAIGSLHGRQGEAAPTPVMLGSEFLFASDDWRRVVFLRPDGSRVVVRTVDR